jgi:hypothetical protein
MLVLDVELVLFFADIKCAHTLTNIKPTEDKNPKAYPAFKYMCADSSIAVTPKSVIDEHVADFDSRRKPTTPDFGVWVEDPKEGTFLVHSSESIMREIFGNVIHFWVLRRYLNLHTYT